MPLFFSMSLAGSIPLCIGLLIMILQKEQTNFYYVNSLFKLSVILYLLPLQLIKNMIPATHNFFTIDNNYTYILSLKNKLQLHFHDKTILVPFWMFFLLLIVTGSIFIFCIYEFRTYRKTCNILLKTSISFKFRKDSCLYKNPLLKTPCTLGFFKSYILFPDQNFTDSQKEMLFIHETAHIENKDSIFKFLIMICFCLHWYNPFVWFFLPVYSYSAECLCDYKVIQRFSSHTERKEYATLLLNIASTESPFPKIWQNNFSVSKRIVKRRLLYIMNTTGVSKKIMLYGALSLLCLIILPLTTYAYTPLEQTSTFSPNEDSKLTEEIITLIDETPSNYADPYDKLVDFSSSNECIVLEDGSVLDSAVPNSSEKSRASCSHTYENGYVYHHTVNKSGGCTITKCKYKKNVVKISTATYVKCTH